MRESHDFSSTKYSFWNVSHVYNEDGIPMHKDDFKKNRPEEFRPMVKEEPNPSEQIEFSISLN